jgi:outer membrane murein-binding lipoprotein Lpp
MTLYNWIVLAVTLAGWVYVLGQLSQRVKTLESKTEKLDDDITALESWGKREISAQINYRDQHFVSLDRFNECTTNISRRLDSFDALEIGAQLAEIKTMLQGIKEQIRSKGGV